MDFDKNLLRLANFPFKLCTSFNVLSDWSFTIASAFSGHALIPFVFTTWPREHPFFRTKGVHEEFERVSVEEFDLQINFQTFHWCDPAAMQGDRDLPTMKFIQALAECSLSPTNTNSDISPSGQEISPLNPISVVVGGIILFLTSG
ncbi:hypothetical protein Tco_1156945 [Tanacetum coccineum]